MCGIVGFQGQFNKSNLIDGIKTLSHRGPDDEGNYIDNKNKVFLGHTRLSILDLSKWLSTNKASIKKLR